MYPWCAFCILFWHGTNLLLDVKFVVLLLVCGGLAVYERSHHEASGEPEDSGIIGCPHDRN